MGPLDKLSAAHLDVLKEIGNIGVGRAATSLSRLLGQSIDMSVPSARLRSFSELLDQEEAERAVAAAYFNVNGGLHGHLFIMFAVEEAERLLRAIVHDEPISIEQLLETTVCASAFGEIGNILAGSYLSALSDFSGLNVFPSPPEICVDMVSAIVTEGLIDLSRYGDKAIVIDAVLMNTKTTELIQSSFTFLPDPADLDKLMEILGVNDG